MAGPVSINSPVLPFAMSIIVALLLLALPPRAADAAGNLLVSGETIRASGRLAYGGHSFVMGADCNLVLDGGVWQSGTAGRGSGCRLTLEGDGRLVVRSEDVAKVWASPEESDRRGEHVAVLEPRGRVTVYGPAVWSSAEPGGHQLRSWLGCLNGGKWDNCIIGVEDDSELLTSPLLLRRVGHGVRRQKLNCLNGGKWDNCIIGVDGAHEILTSPLPLRRSGHGHRQQKLSCLRGGKWDNCLINGAAPAAGNVLFSGERRLRLRGGCSGGRCFLRLDNRGGLTVMDDEHQVVWSNSVRAAQGEYVAVLRRDGEVAVYGPAAWSTSGGAGGYDRGATRLERS